MDTYRRSIPSISNLKKGARMALPTRLNGENISSDFFNDIKSELENAGTSMDAYALLAGRTGDTYKVDDIVEFTSSNGVNIENINITDYTITDTSANQGVLINSANDTNIVSCNNSGFRLTSGSRVTSILDEDTMSSNSDVALATQQSIRAYIDGKNDKVIAVYKTNSAQVIPATATGDVIYDFDTSVIDTHSAVTTGASWKFTAPTTDKYRVVAYLTSSATAASVGRVFNSIYVDTGGGAAAAYIIETSFDTATRVGACIIEVILSLSANDTVDYRNRNTTASTLSVSGDARQNYILIESLNDV
jgi:hypothetical protein